MANQWLSWLPFLPADVPADFASPREVAAFELAQEDDRVVHLLDRDVVVLHARAHLLHLVEFCLLYTSPSPRD